MTRSRQYTTETMTDADYTDDLVLLVYTSAWWLVGFYGISTFVGYLMSNPFYINSSISNNSV